MIMPAKTLKMRKKTKNIYMRMFSTDMIHFLSANLQSAQTQLHI